MLSGNIVNMAVSFQVFINDSVLEAVYGILSTILFPIYRGLIIVFGFPMIKSTTISLNCLDKASYCVLYGNYRYL